MINKMALAPMVLMWLLLGVFSSGPVQAAPWELSLLLREAARGSTLQQPMFMALDEGRERYYVVDPLGGKLISYDRDGKFLAAFEGAGRFKAPVSMARSASGKLWVVERSNNRLYYIDPEKLEAWDFALRYPDGGAFFADKIALDDQGRLFVLDRLRGAVSLVDDNVKIVKTYQGPAGARGMVDFKIKDDGIWALDGVGGKVYRFNPDGRVGEEIALSKTLEFPASLEIDRSGRLYILDRHAGTVNVFTPGGRFEYDFLTRGKARGQLWSGAHLLFDWAERLCIVDEGNAKVEIFRRR